MAKVLKEEMLRHYTAEIQSGDAALFVGAGMSRESGFVDWKGLMREVAVELGLDVEREFDLIALAQYHVNERGGRARINRLLIEEFTKDAKRTENHRLIATLPVRKVWTTNYDELLESAYKDANRRPDVKTTAANLAQTLSQRDVVIFKMHGDCKQPQDAVLTKEDYETYGEKREVFSTALKGDLVERTFLFLGFSFTDPNIDYILSRIRGLLGQNQRSHYCVMKWPDIPNDHSGERRAQYEYDKRKLELRISDLSRYQIHAVMIDEYKEITEILRELNRRSHLKHIFVSGSAHAYEPFGKGRFEGFLLRLGHEIIQRGFSLVSGFGLGVGGTVSLGAMEELYATDLPFNRLSLHPFPRQTAPTTARPEVFNKYRENMLATAGFAIFIGGNKREDGTDGPSVAKGVLEEFELVRSLGKVPVPIGATGWAAEEIWNTVNKNQGTYFGARDVAAQLKVLGEPAHSDDEYIKAIFGIISEMSH